MHALRAACYDYAMSRTVQVRFVSPKDIEINEGVIRTRVWDGEKPAAFHQAGLEPPLSPMMGDLELQVIVAKTADVRFHWKSEKAGALRELIGTVMEEVEPGENLSE